MDGVLKSWAVTHGPSLVPGEKRLAVHVEDHPLEYGNFEGTIPKGEYGGGTVIVWDRGTWTPVATRSKGFAKGHLEFELHGEKLHGRWHLVRMHGKPREKRENWLLIKGDDEVARDGERSGHSRGAAGIGEDRPRDRGRRRRGAGLVVEDRQDQERSPLTARPAPRPPNRREPDRSATVLWTVRDQGQAKKAALPGLRAAHTRHAWSKTPPAGERWMHEIKFDGYRLQARIEGGKVKLLTRSGLDWTQKFGKAIGGRVARLCRSAPP